MSFDPTIIESVAQGLEAKAGRAIGFGVVIGLILIGPSALGVAVALAGSFPDVVRFGILMGAGFGILLGLGVISRAFAEAARLRLQAQVIRLGLALEENTRRTAEALESFIALSR